MAILNLGNFPDTKLDNFSPTDQSIIYSKTAGALANLGGIKNAEKFFQLACKIADENLDKSDPAIKSLAISGNNIATTLEEKKNRNEKENELMLFAAKKARIYWEMAGTWLEVERAEYRLSKTNLQLKDFNQALIHAEQCLKIVVENKAAALEAFFAYELTCLIHHALKNKEGFNRSLELMKREYDNLKADEIDWCRDVLNLIENLN
jgi:tetratricopeptide (TPR) repeat protein